MFKYLYRLPSASVLFSTTRKLTTVCSNPSFSFSIKLCNLRKNKSNFGALFIPKGTFQLAIPFLYLLFISFCSFDS